MENWDGNIARMEKWDGDILRLENCDRYIEGMKWWDSKDGELGWRYSKVE